MEKDKIHLIMSKLEGVRDLIDEIEEIIKPKDSSYKKNVFADATFEELMHLYTALQEAKTTGDIQKIESIMKKLGFKISKIK